MGCDIHGAIEVRDTLGNWNAVTRPNKYYGKWEDEEPVTAQIDIGRNYNAFAVLANVRNSSPPYELNFISDSRGLPSDISVEAQEACNGDHSATFVTLGDILEFDWSQKTKETGIVNILEFERWDRIKEWNPTPQSYSGGVWGPTVQQVDNDRMREIIKSVIGDKRGAEYQEAMETLKKDYSGYYTEIEWGRTYADAVGDFWTVVVPEMMALGHKAGDLDAVRMVMNFDS